MTFPARIGKYTITEVLGKGSMGTVYKGFDPHIQRPVAIKTIHKELLGDPDAVDSIPARFRNEAKAVGRIVHPGVVAIYEYGEDERMAYIAMEFVRGRTLEDILAETAQLPLEQVLRIMDELLEALTHAHAHGVWHRDVKPTNLIVTEDGRIKLTDFGIARISDAGLTQAASAIGTPSYMAPEQFRGEGVDHRADLFACGVVLYRLVTGMRPFSGSTEVVMYKILAEEPPAPSAVAGAARAGAFDAIVARAIAKRADDRFQDARSMRQALRGVRAADQDATHWITPPPRAAAAPANPLLGGTVFGAPARAPARAPAEGSSSGVAPSNWDPAELSRLERALASHIGPIARRMVRDAARDCADSSSLAQALARHIPEEASRRHFIDAAQGGGSGARAPAVAPAPSSADPLTDEFKARALQSLTRRLGPIAKVMVRRAAEQSAGDRRRFVEKLVDACDEGQRAALRHELEG